jgi:hypothetical protein
MQRPDPYATAPQRPQQARLTQQPVSVGGQDTTSRIKNFPPPQTTAVPVTNRSQSVTTPPVAPVKLPKEEVLIKAYEQIRSEKITSPDTIRDIASRFQAIANDPVARQNVSFDAARTAQVLFDRANMLEEQARAEASFNAGFHYDSEEGYDDTTLSTPGWQFRSPTDENLTAGG